MFINCTLVFQDQRVCTIFLIFEIGHLRLLHSYSVPGFRGTQRFDVARPCTSTGKDWLPVPVVAQGECDSTIEILQILHVLRLISSSYSSFSWQTMSTLKSQGHRATEFAAIHRWGPVSAGEFYPQVASDGAI